MMDLLSSSSIATSLLAGSAIALAVIAIKRIRNIYSYWEKRNLPGPKPIFPFGNYVGILYNIQNKFMSKCVREYGKVFGAYEGFEPVLMVADPEIARQICISDFDAFTDHKFARFFTAIQRKFVFSLKGDHWRRIRAMMSPTFTSKKMRRMMKLLEACADDLVLCMEEQLEASSGYKTIVDLKDTYTLYSMNAISTCCYAIKIERQNNAKSLKAVASWDEFASSVLNMFTLSIPRTLLVLFLPDKILDWLDFNVISDSNVTPVVKRVEKMIGKRHKGDSRFDDYLQMLLDAKLDDEFELDELDVKENHHAALTNESLISNQRKLVAEVEASARDKTEPGTQSAFVKRPEVSMNNEEVLASATFLMSVGLETTSNLLAHCTYALAFHKHIQDKLWHEIDKLATSNSSTGDDTGPAFDYDSITSCAYLDAVISETLRSLSLVIRTDRSCVKEYYLDKYNLTIPEGAKVVILLQELMNHPDYWEHPEKFDPERFMPENRHKIVPGTYCPFGLGPRHCLGMRFSLTESKLALARIIYNYEFSPAPNTKFPPEAKPNFGLRQAKNPIVCFKRRD